MSSFAIFKIYKLRGGLSVNTWQAVAHQLTLQGPSAQQPAKRRGEYLMQRREGERDTYLRKEI